MEGRKYNRAVRFTSYYMRLAWEGFLPWLEATHSSDVIHVDATLQTIRTFSDDVCHRSCQQVLDTKSCVRVMQLFGIYLSFLRDGNGNLSTFWMSYVDVLWASREDDWLLHLVSINDMIHGALPMTDLTMPDTSPTTTHKCLDCTLMNQRCMPTSWMVFSQYRSDQQIHSEGFQWTKPSKRQQTQTPGGTKEFGLKARASTIWQQSTWASISDSVEIWEI